MRERYTLPLYCLVCMYFAQYPKTDIILLILFTFMNRRIFEQNNVLGATNANISHDVKHKIVSGRL